MDWRKPVRITDTWMLSGIQYVYSFSLRGLFAAVHRLHVEYLNRTVLLAANLASRESVTISAAYSKQAVPKRHSPLNKGINPDT